MSHPAYPNTVMPEAVEILESFRLSEDIRVPSLAADIHRAFYTLAHSLADRVPNHPELPKALQEFREAMDAFVELARER